MKKKIDVITWYFVFYHPKGSHIPTVIGSPMASKERAEETCERLSKQTPDYIYFVYEATAISAHNLDGEEYSEYKARVAPILKSNYERKVR